MRSNGWIIKGVIMQNEQLFQDGILVQMLSQSSNTITVSVNTEKNVEQVIDVKIITG